MSLYKIWKTDKIYIAYCKEEVKGRGVFANKDFKKDEVIERCPTIPITTKEYNKGFDDTILSQYIFMNCWNGAYWNEEDGYILVFGYGSIYNHSRNPNMMVSVDTTLENCLLFTALCDIKKDDELTYDYEAHEGYFDIEVE